MSRYRAERFNFSQMSERITFQLLNSDGSYTDNIRVWAHLFKDGFTRSETDNWFKILVREQAALESILAVGNRIKWKKMTLSIFSWRDPSVEDRGFIEILAKEIIAINEDGNAENEFDMLKDIVSVYSMTKIEVNRFGLVSYEYNYDFENPVYTGIRCSFSSDRNRFLDDKSFDTEHDSLIVTFSANAPIKIEDYIESPAHGRFKVDMIVKTDENKLLAYVQRGEVQ